MSSPISILMRTHYHAVRRLLFQMIVILFWLTPGFGEDAASEFVRWRKEAEAGNTPAMVITADNFDRGRGVAEDSEQAYQWYRKAAENGHSLAQYVLGERLEIGIGCPKDLKAAAIWYLRSAESGHADAQYQIASCYLRGLGVTKDEDGAVKWLDAAARQGHARAQMVLAICYRNPDGKIKDNQKAAEWMLLAAKQGLAEAQLQMGLYCFKGDGVTKNFVDAYKWALLAHAQSVKGADTLIRALEKAMTSQQTAEGQAEAREFKATTTSDQNNPSAATQSPNVLKGAGSGFFISEDGYIVTSGHVIQDATKVVVIIEGRETDASVISVDKSNDLALLKVAGDRFHPLSIAVSRSVHLGDTVFTVGFPNVLLQGSSPKLAKGEIASLNGIKDDPRHFQVSVPVQPGNSGGALVDSFGNVVGIISHKINQLAALASSGSTAEAVNYAVKSSFLLGFLESVPALEPKLAKGASTKKDFNEIVNNAEKAAVLILIK